MLEDHIDLINKISYSLSTKCPRWTNEEIYSCALVHAWNRLKKFDDSKTKIEIYLNFTVKKDVVYDYMHDMGYRKQADRKWIRRYNNKTNIDFSALDCKTFNDLSYECLEELTDNQKIIVKMKIDNQTQDFIGKRLGKSRSWVCGELKKIRNILENCNGNNG
jgi:RNA polymerase sigma factor (sigma-70 family)